MYGMKLSDLQWQVLAVPTGRIDLNVFKQTLRGPESLGCPREWQVRTGG